MAADRSTLAKVTPPHPLAWAAVVHVDGAPGVVGLAHPVDGADPLFLVRLLNTCQQFCYVYK